MIEVCELTKRYGRAVAAYAAVAIAAAAFVITRRDA